MICLIIILLFDEIFNIILSFWFVIINRLFKKIVWLGVFGYLLKMNFFLIFFWFRWFLIIWLVVLLGISSFWFVYFLVFKLSGVLFFICVLNILLVDICGIFNVCEIIFVCDFLLVLGGFINIIFVFIRIIFDMFFD